MLEIESPKAHSLYDDPLRVPNQLSNLLKPSKSFEILGSVDLHGDLEILRVNRTSQEAELWTVRLSAKWPVLFLGNSDSPWTKKGEFLYYCQGNYLEAISSGEKAVLDRGRFAKGAISGSVHLQDPSRLRIPFKRTTVADDKLMDAFIWGLSFRLHQTIIFTRNSTAGSVPLKLDGLYFPLFSIGAFQTVAVAVIPLRIDYDLDDLDDMILTKPAGSKRIPHTLFLTLINWKPSPSNSTFTPEIKRLHTLVPRLECKRSELSRFSFHFSPSTNQLFCCLLTGITRYSSVFEFDPSPFGPQMTWFSPNLSELLETESSPVPHTLELRQKATGSSWKVHYDIFLQHPGINTRSLIETRLVPTIENSQHGAPSISYFLRYLYFSHALLPSYPYYNFTYARDAIELSRSIGLDCNYLHWMMKNKIVPFLSNSELLSLAMTSCSSSTPTNCLPAIDILIERCKSTVTLPEMLAALENFELNKNITPTTRNLLGAKMILYFSPNASMTVPISEISDKRPSMKALPLVFVKTIPECPPEDVHSYIFSIEGKREQGAFISYSWLLYPQWKWFKRLVNSNCLETLSRHVVMPKDLSSDMLRLILSVSHGSYLGLSSLSIVPETELLTLYLFCSELQLDDSPAYGLFVKDCFDTLIASVTNQNCIGKAIEWWKSGCLPNQALLLHALKVVCANMHIKPIIEWLDVPHDLQLVLTTLYKHGEHSAHFKDLASKGR